MTKLRIATTREVQLEAQFDADRHGSTVRIRLVGEVEWCATPVQSGPTDAEIADAVCRNLEVELASFERV